MMGTILGARRDGEGVDRPIEIGAGRSDRVGLALLTMAHELWVIKDRQMVTEALLQEHGLLQALDSYQPDAALAARIGAERDRFTRSITTVLATGEPAER